MSANKKLAAEVRWGNAQLAEKRAREANNPAGIEAAKAEQVEAMDEIARIDEETRTDAKEERVTLIGPNPYANIVDSNGVEVTNGRAEGVRRSLARKYLEDLDGYTIEETT